jgi:hypothetical protein
MHATKPVTVRPTKPTPNVSEVVTIESALCGDLLKAGALSMKEIDKLIGDLQVARDYIRQESEQLQKQAARYAHLSRTALASVTLVNEGLNKWRENASLPQNQSPELSFKPDTAG